MTESVDLKSQEVQDAIAAAVEAAVTGLKDKNSELLGKLAKAKQGQTIDPAELVAVESERDALKAQLSDANKAAKKAVGDLDLANKRVADTDAAFNRTLVDAALSDALTKAGVTNPVHIKAVKAMHAAELKVSNEGDTRVIKAGEKNLTDFITEWAASDEGKHFVAAPASQGDGARGGYRGNSNTKSVTRDAFSNMTPSEQSAHAISGGAITDA